MFDIVPVDFAQGKIECCAYIFLIAKEGNLVEIRIDFEIVPAAEHFANQKNEQTFLMGNFNISTLGRNTQFQRCFACSFN